MRPFESFEPPAAARVNYINAQYGLKSWLLTKDHKRIALLYLIAAWALVRGIFEIVTAIQLRKEISYEWALIISGLISIIFGIVLLANPGAGALAMVVVIGAFALMFGVMMIVLAFRVRGLPKRLERLPQT